VSHPCEVVFDARWLRTGIGRYTLTLLRDLKKGLPDTLLTCITMPAHVQTVAPLCDQVIEMSCGIYSLTEQAQLTLIARNASVFCSPHYNIPIFRTGPLVATIHDLTHLIFPAYRRRLHARFYAELMLRVACSRAAHLVTPSHYTRQMLIDRLGADPDKISIISCAVSEVFRQRDKAEAASEVRESYGISPPYILFIGSTAPHKNLMTLLAAYRQLSSKRRDMPPLVLVLPQKSHSSLTDAKLLSLMAMPRVHSLHMVDDHSLASLYSAALMTVVPSFEEGFGLPVIESMACGIPVVCSRAASLPEIAGDNAIYFSPDSADDIATAIEQVLDSQALHQQLSAAGLKRAARYSGSHAAETYASILSSITRDERPRDLQQ